MHQKVGIEGRKGQRKERRIRVGGGGGSRKRSLWLGESREARTNGCGGRRRVGT